MVGLGLGKFEDLACRIVDKKLGFKNEYRCSRKEKRIDLGLGGKSIFFNNL